MKRRLNSRPPEPSRITLLLVILGMALVGRCTGVQLQDIVTAHRDIVAPRSEVIN